MIHYLKKNRYLKACAQAGLAELSGDDRNQLYRVAAYVKKHAGALWYVHALEEGGAQVADILFSHAGVSFSSHVRTLLEILIHQLIVERTMSVLPWLLAELADKQASIRARILTSHPLSDKHKKIYSDYFSGIMGKSVTPEFVIDATLIAGMRFEAANSIWEDSVRQRLRTVSVSMQG